VEDGSVGPPDWLLSDSHSNTVLTFIVAMDLVRPTTGYTHAGPNGGPTEAEMQNLQNDGIDFWREMDQLHYGDQRKRYKISRNIQYVPSIAVSEVRALLPTTKSNA